MRNIRIIFFIGIICWGCQDVIEVDLEEGEKQLVVEANIDWKVNTKGEKQSVILSTTMPYFQKGDAPKVSGAIVSVTDEKGKVFSFTENSKEKGVYQTNVFSPTLSEEYTLHIEYKGQHYIAKDRMHSIPSELQIHQINEGGIFGKEIEIRGYFKDDSQKKNNFYLVRIDSKRYKKPTYISLDGNLFTQNNLFFIYSSKEIKLRDTLQIRVYSISASYYDYINQLLSLAQGGTGKGPFSTPPSGIRGNVINEKDPNKNLLGAFRASQYLEKEYILK